MEGSARSKRRRAATQGSVVLYQGAAGIYGLSFFLASVALARRALGLARVASGVLVAGLALHAVVLVLAVRTSGPRILTTPLGITSGFTFVALFLAYLTALRYRMRQTLCVLFVVPVLVSLASLTVDPGFAPFGHRLDSAWMQLHLAALVVAYSAFSLSASLGVMLVARSRVLKSKTLGFLDDVLPPLMDLDDATMASLHAGFGALSLALALGAVHVRLVGWETAAKVPKAFLAILTWLVYGLALGGRRLRGWRGQQVGWMALVAAAIAFGSFVAMQVVGRSA